MEEVTSLPRLKTLEEDGRISETPEVPPAAAPAPMKESGATFTFKLPDNTSKEARPESTSPLFGKPDQTWRRLGPDRLTPVPPVWNMLT